MIRKTLRFVIDMLFKLLSNLHVEGIENVPPTGGCLIACNHFSRLDPALVFALVERTDLTALVADKYKGHPLIRPLINAVGGIWLHREDADIHALREARHFLQAGGALGIAPEGTRSKTGSLVTARLGAAYLADKSGVPVVPVAIYGTGTALRQLLHFHRPAIYIQFGAPFTLPAVQRERRDLSLRQNTDEIMCRIAAMLPAETRGVYADHPRLKELLSTSLAEDSLAVSAPTPNT